MFAEHAGANELPCLGIAEVADLTGISAFTIRYYDRCGFFPGLARDRRGVRSFSHADVAQLRFVDALRKSGLSIEGIQYYVRLQRRGIASSDERLPIVRAQEAALECQVSGLEECLKRLRSAEAGLLSAN
ncbi:MerR family transcriptional regulator [Gordonibacter sp. An230]|uniref:MerR family transcriptional regulator n=1 Tax=Gordonibacter sp. An230 TaxID=1965592 RepID=UPI000B366884|nr:MerR family transcriptional regulator [Gordonibacter sp. An230]OUO91478.1 MerR family transcriptional regulator [Gordonibacter sp. An230]